MKTLTDLQLDLVEEKKANEAECGIYATDALMKLMEEMAGAPREEIGERQPGERGSYEKYQDSH